MTTASTLPQTTDAFSWFRVRELYAYNSLWIRKQLWIYLAVAIFFSLLTLIPAGSLGQLSIFSMVWTILPLMAEFAPLVFVKNGDSRIIDRLLPASAGEKFVFYLTYLFVIIPAVVFILPQTALWLYTKIPSIQTSPMSGLLKFRFELPASMVALNILTVVAAISACLAVVLRCRTNRFVKGIFTVFGVQIGVGLLGAVYGIQFALRKGIEDGVSGAHDVDSFKAFQHGYEAGLSTTGEVMNVIIADTVYIYFVICLAAVFSLWMLWLCYRAIHSRNL